MKNTKLKLILLLLLSTSICFATEKEVSIKSSNIDIYGTLDTPYNFSSGKIILMISGSGPTDRNGNNQAMKNNSLKLFAEDLSRVGVASLRYDKRLIGKSVSSVVSTTEKDLRFDDYVKDANLWVEYLSKNSEYKEIYIMGHSEGALIGALVAASNPKVSGYISTAGPGRSADIILKEQLAGQPQEAKNMMFKMIDQLKKGEMIKNVPASLNAIFRESIQPYMISWFKYDPSEIVAKLTIPTLIIQGDKDIQVSVEDAKLLKNANPKARLEIIKDMNHVLKYCNSMDPAAQTPTYYSPDIPLSADFSLVVLDFLGIKGFAEY